MLMSCLSISLGVLSVLFFPTRIPHSCALLPPVCDLSGKKTWAIRGQSAKVWDSPHSCLQIISTPHEMKRQMFIFMKFLRHRRQRWMKLPSTLVPVLRWVADVCLFLPSLLVCKEIDLLSSIQWFEECFLQKGFSFKWTLPKLSCSKSLKVKATL